MPHIRGKIIFTPPIPDVSIFDVNLGEYGDLGNLVDEWEITPGWARPKERTRFVCCLDEDLETFLRLLPSGHSISGVLSYVYGFDDECEKPMAGLAIINPGTTSYDDIHWESLCDTRRVRETEMRNIQYTLSR
jgi:hypothetical protein